MLKKEFKRNLKALLIWSFAFALLLGGTVLLYPHIMGDAVGEMDKLLSTMPKEILEIFNMDKISLEKASGWLLSEGYMMITLIGSIYTAMLGANILLKEEENKTIFFLATKPVSKSKILISKVIVGIICILIFNLIISDTLFITLYLTDDLVIKEWALMLVGALFIHLFMFSVAFLISVFVRKNNVSLGASIGFVFITYVLSIIGNLSDKTEFIKYLSPFYYVDGATIITDGNLNIINLCILFIISIILIIISNCKYKKKELF